MNAVWEKAYAMKGLTHQCKIKGSIGILEIMLFVCVLIRAIKTC